MFDLTNFVNNHLATVYAHPVNAARLQAKGMRLNLPVDVKPPVGSTDQPATPATGLRGFTQHFFVDKPAQTFDVTRAVDR